MNAHTQALDPEKDRRYIKLFLSLFFALVLFAYRETWPLDLSALYFAARFYHDGQFDQIFPIGTAFLWDPDAYPRAWRLLAAGEISRFDSPTLYLTPFVYPPIWAAVLAPMAGVLSFKLFWLAWLSIYAGCIVWMFFLSYRLVRPTRLSMPTWILILLPFVVFGAAPQLALNLGQPQILVAMLTLQSFVWLSEGKPRRAGAILALAAAIKLTPALFALIFLMERDWKALGWFAAVGAALAGASVAVTGWPLHDQFLRQLALLDGQVLISRINLSLNAVLTGVGSLFNGASSQLQPDPGFIAEPAWVSWVMRLALILSPIAIFVTTRDHGRRKRTWLRIMMVAMMTLFLSPLGWLHYLVLPIFLLPGLLEFSGRRWVVPLLGLVGVGLSLPVYFLLALYPSTFLLQVAMNVGICGAIVAALVATSRGAACRGNAPSVRV